MPRFRVIAEEHREYIEDVIAKDEVEARQIMIEALHNRRREPKVTGIAKIDIIQYRDPE